MNLHGRAIVLVIAALAIVVVAPLKALPRILPRIVTLCHSRGTTCHASINCRRVLR